MTNSRRRKMQRNLSHMMNEQLNWESVVLSTCFRSTTSGREANLRDVTVDPAANPSVTELHQRFVRYGSKIDESPFAKVQTQNHLHGLFSLRLSFPFLAFCLH